MQEQNHLYHSLVFNLITMDIPPLEIKCSDDVFITFLRIMDRLQI